MTLTSINPATGKLISSYPEINREEAFHRCQKGQEAFKEWRKLSFKERASCLKKLEEKLLGKKESFALLMTSEMGKPIHQALLEIEKCASVCAYYAENGERFLQPIPVDIESDKSYIAYEPLGVILAIMPWNFPFWQVFRAAVPALMAGNGMVLKHASNVSGCAVAIGKLFQDAGFPESIFQTLLIGSKTALSLIETPLIQGVTLTGSVATGKSVAAKAGEYLKKCVLELGGSDPYVILEDANLEEAASIICQSRLNNAGQSCISPKRIIVVGSQYDNFEKLFIDQMKLAILGDPLDEKTTVGPLARVDIRETIHDQVTKSIKLGAHCVLGGIIPEGKGVFYPPTLLTNVIKGMPAYDEELFGPVAVLIQAKDEEEAIRIANDTPYGLGAAVFTRDREKGERIAVKELEAGNCFVNSPVRSDLKLPFGGVKESGFGRELSSVGIKEFTNCKAILIL